MKKITPFLWFNDNLGEAIDFYTSIFKNAKVEHSSKNGNKVVSAAFHLDGQDFLALDGGPHFTFSPAVSFFINCETQEEIDEFWEKLSTGGESQRCGWLKDKFGLSWQIVPSILGHFLQNENREKANRTMQAMLQMNKLDIETLQRAFDGN
ncbi:VOC family protein [Leptospira sp. 201903070]|uniref:VOC family protein n=1 Tax=Leptospira ainlahdjerensis TaxID=2810033 RepID=A0ABS2UFW5_9LEPT|nr:VOC family protein [Leptospira ainlahdjerensis]MBM9578147.1 VOC family protein [Leptospira ainlahdjerensis]